MNSAQYLWSPYKGKKNIDETGGEQSPLPNISIGGKMKPDYYS